MANLIELKTFCRLRKQARITVWHRYDPACKRYNEDSGNFEIMVINSEGEKVFAPLDYFVDQRFSHDDIEQIRNGV